MKHKIAVVTGTRAEYGLLRRVLQRLQKESSVQLDLIVTGSHLSERLGNTKIEIIEDGFADFTSISLPLEEDSKYAMAQQTAVVISKFAEYWKLQKPDLLVVLGDRYEIFGVATVAHILGIPIAHISGGDVTEGAIDDAFRHSISKMSTLHFAGCIQSAKRLIQMGEMPQFVYNVGEPGVENCLKLKVMTREELKLNLGFEGIDRDYAVVTFHPVTMEQNSPREQLKELIKAMDLKKELCYVITMANADAGGKEINDIWQVESQKRENWYVVSSLGAKRYLSALKYAKMVLGNSSSGVLEAPAMGIPTVNIGDRQKGRMQAKSVVTCLPVAEDILKAMDKVLQPNFLMERNEETSPYGDGNTSAKIVDTIMLFLEETKVDRKKKFYDIVF